ncbi:hypothetical protein HAX54_025986 [Datura stramonium]|uniref:MADS-box domain-containing protein n=1 Tax=Datura stramonium TaxID=4076 RepID=A0ABS8Y7S9_DATST|nr:hypothetical protein [Datura stramonium]
MAEKKTLGSQKIPMARIENEDDRYSTFSKRQSGLYKKADELIAKDDVDEGKTLFYPVDKSFSIFYPTTDVVIDYFFAPAMEPNESSCLDAENARNKVKEQKTKLDIVEKTLCSQTPNSDEAGNKIFWKPLEKYNEEEKKKLEYWLTTVDIGLNTCLKQLENGASSLAQAPPKNAN